MQFTVTKTNGGQFHWKLVDDDGIDVAVSAASFDTLQAAQRSATAVQLGAGSAPGADD